MKRDDVEYATLEHADWFNERRLHGELGMVPPAELEASYYQQAGSGELAKLSANWNLHRRER